MKQKNGQGGVKFGIKERHGGKKNLKKVSFVHTYSQKKSALLLQHQEIKLWVMQQHPCADTSHSAVILTLLCLILFYPPHFKHEPH